MAKIIFIVNVLFCFCLAEAKDYSPVVINDTAFFTSESTDYAGTFDIKAIRVDSIKYFNDTTMYELNRTWDLSDYSCIKPNGPSWIGYSIVELPDSTYILYNESNEEIILKPLLAINSNWIMYNYPNGDYIIATINTVKIETFLGITDSVKHIIMEKRNSNGDKINHRINDIEFSISNHFIP